MQFYQTAVTTTTTATAIIDIPVVATKERPLFLRVVETHEAFASGNASPDVHSIYMAVPNGGGALLKQEYVDGSGIVWNGNIPIYDPIHLIVSFAWPASGNLVYVSYGLSEAGE